MDYSIDYGLVCDYATKGEKNKQSFIGVFENLTVYQKNNYIHPLHFYVGVRFNFNGTGNEKMVIFLRPPEDNQEDKEVMEAELNVDKAGAASFSFPIVNFKFDTEGLWRIMAKIGEDGEIEMASLNVKHLDN